MKKWRKKYSRPLKPFDKERIEKEKEILKNFGLRRKKEIWKAEAMLRKYRRLAREALAKKDKKMEEEIISKLAKLGILKEGACLDDVLSLTVENFLDRRLQSIVFKKGLANTQKQARQFIVHGKVRIGNRRIVYPSYLVPRSEEDKIQVDIIPQKSKGG